MRLLANAFVREAAALGAAVSVTIDGIALLAGADATTQGVIHGITAVWVGWYVRSMSTPRAAAAERVEAAATAARHEALADVASLKPAAPAKRAAAKKARG